jgi:uncharacterized protein (TIGR02757 family)
MLVKETSAFLKTLADKYEKASFMDADPSRFLRRYSKPRDQELAAFVVSQLSFGQREQFIAKLDAMFDAADGWALSSGNGGKPKTRGASFADWLTSGGYKKFFPKSQKKFYRFFSYADMAALCGRLAQIVEESGSLGAAVRARYGLADASGIATVPSELRLVTALISLFPGVKCVSQNPKGACKKLHMFLRWMVRKGSPVDLGLWEWANPADLLIPLDTHVLQESARLGLIAPNATASAKTAIELTQKMAQVFPEDPTRADFALFGLGVDQNLGQNDTSFRKF